MSLLVYLGVFIGLSFFLLFCYSLSKTSVFDCDTDQELTEEELLFVYGDK